MYYIQNNDLAYYSRYCKFSWTVRRIWATRLPYEKAHHLMVTLAARTGTELCLIKETPDGAQFVERIDFSPEAGL